VVERGHCGCREFYFFNGKGIEIMNWEQIVSYTTYYCQQLRQQSFFSDRMSYIVLRGR
jgi:hypothetical protein